MKKIEECMKCKNGKGGGGIKNWKKKCRDKSFEWGVVRKKLEFTPRKAPNHISYFIIRLFDSSRHWNFFTVSSFVEEFSQLRPLTSPLLFFFLFLSLTHSLPLAFPFPAFPRPSFLVPKENGKKKFKIYHRLVLSRLTSHEFQKRKRYFFLLSSFSFHLYLHWFFFFLFSLILYLSSLPDLDIQNVYK